MTPEAFALVCLLALAVLAAGAVLVVWRMPAALLVARRRRRVVLTLKAGDAFAGLLYSTDREALVLREAQALAYGTKKDNVIVEGELLVLRADVAYLQILPTGTAVAS